MSDEFVLSQEAYYRRNLNNGPSRDWNLISGLWSRYYNEARKRGLIA